MTHHYSPLCMNVATSERNSSLSYLRQIFALEEARSATTSGKPALPSQQGLNTGTFNTDANIQCDNCGQWGHRKRNCRAEQWRIERHQRYLQRRQQSPPAAQQQQQQQTNHTQRGRGRGGRGRSGSRHRQPEAQQVSNSGTGTGDSLAFGVEVTKGFMFDNWREGLFVVNTLCLCVAFSYKPCFVTFNRSVGFSFNLEHPSILDYFLTSRPWD